MIIFFNIKNVSGNHFKRLSEVSGMEQLSTTADGRTFATRNGLICAQNTQIK